MLTTFEMAVDPLALLKSPMILIGIVGFAFVIGMPYLMDNSTCTSHMPSHIFN